MKLSKFERLLLINQYDILKVIDPDNSKEYDLNREVLMQGYEQHYDELVTWLMEDFPEGKSEEVISILQMYRSLNFSYQNLDGEEKQKIEVEKLKFKGFDGNNETSYMTYARFFMHDMDRYKELWDNEKYPDYNTHWPVLGMYRKMLSVWESFDKKYSNDLTVEEILKITNV